MLGCKSSLGLEAGHRPKSSLGLGVTECQAQAVTIDSLWWPQHLADGAAILFSLSLSLNQYPGHQEVLLILVLLPQTFSSFPNFTYLMQYTTTSVLKLVFLLPAIFLCVVLLYR